MTNQKVRELLNNYGTMRIRAALCERGGSECTEEAKKEALVFNLIKLCIEQLPIEEKNLLEKVYVGKQQVSRCARELGYSRRNLYYQLDKIMTKLAASLSAIEKFSQ